MKQIVLGICLLASPAMAEIFTGNDLHRFCQQGRVTMYVAGFLDKADQDSIFTFFVMPGDESPARTASIRTVQGAIKGYCLPEKATLDQVVDVVCKYVRENPKERNKTGAAMISSALPEAFPCSK